MSTRFDSTVEDKFMNDVFRMSIVDDSETIQHWSWSDLSENDLTLANRSLVCVKADLVLAETESKDSFKLSSLDARSAICCWDCERSTLVIRLRSVNFDDKTSFSACADWAIAETESIEVLRLATVTEVCAFWRCTDRTVSITAASDELKPMNCGDKDVAFPRARSALAEVVSNDTLMLSMRDAK